MLDLLGAVKRWGKPRILVVGDVMLDRYSYGVVERISPEAPVPILSQVRHETRLGGAGSVACLLAHLGCSVQLVGLVGADEEGLILRRLLEDTQVDGSLVLVDDQRPTTTKHRFLGRSDGCQVQQLLRVDCESHSPARLDNLTQWLQGIELHLPSLDAVLVSDYAKGVCTADFLKHLTELSSGPRLPIVVDPARTQFCSKYTGVTCMTPNRAEAAAMLNERLDTVQAAMRAAARLKAEYDLSGVVVTLDADGIVLFEGQQATHFPASVREVCDITGAGDVVLAVVGICLANRQNWSQAVQLANIAAGMAIQRVGVASISREELLAELTPDEMVNRSVHILR